jgi:hypothetical protein
MKTRMAALEPVPCVDAKHVAFPPGTWTLTAGATDRSGNVGTSVLHFTVT